MSTFSNRIKEKKILDMQRLSSASESVYDSLQKRKSHQKAKNRNEQLEDEFSHICNFFGMEEVDFPDEMQDAESFMQFLMSETGIMRRKVVLTDQWWKDGATPLLCSDKEGHPYALIPASGGGYVFFQDGKQTTVNKKNAEQFLNVCYCFYEPLKQETLSLKEFIAFLCESFHAEDIAWLLAVSFLAGMLGLIMPMINQFVFHSVVPSGTSKELVGISILLIGTVFIQAFCRLANTLWVMRIGNKMELLAQNAVWARVLALPTKFFTKYSSGELADRASSIDTICGILGGQMIPTILSSVFSVVYIFQIRSISGALLAPSVGIIVVIVFVNIGTAFVQIKRTAHNNEVESKLSGKVFQFLNGITKIKVAGAEVRVFEKWAESYRELEIVPKKIILLSSAINTAVTFGGTMVLYIVAYRTDMSASEYIAFHTAFSLFTVAVMSLTNISTQIASLKPALEMLRPILEEKPENHGYRKPVTRLSGDIEINQVRFRYNDRMPYVLNGLELHIKKGEYIGIVGSSGCGKSTLMRILLGFEKPQSGSVYYDRQDMNGLDLRSVRRRIGVVLQNGKLFSGDIYSNIVICAPWLSVDDAWEAAERSGFAEDIENMPMGMFTMISEGGGGLSGGQQQRLLISRALAANPDIVMFDEATSALDNITQEMVVKTLEEMECTRLVIAHRLSTIKNCSRIIYMDKGKIVESGTYEELMELGGKFAQLAERQLV